jgi:predicted ATPase/DNA-binding CsgD family transcriptional regulator
VPLTGALPPEPSSFVGRTAELAELSSVQVGARLLTIVGPGGVGKTRLGMRLAAKVGSAYPGGVWFVDLASVPDPTMLADVVCRVLGVSGEPGQSSLQALIERLRNVRLLLVMDSCERSPDACADFAVALLAGCPLLQLLAISREPLETEGDAIWRVPPLDLPPVTAGPAEVAASDAVQLFVARARAHTSRFSVSGANYAEIARMCRSVGGMPLALEVIAAHVGGSADLARLTRVRTSDRRHTGVRRRGPQQQIVRETLDWAHGQMTASQRLLFRRLGVFEGTWDLAATQAVCCDHRLSPDTAATQLERLVAAALVTAEPQPYGPRYRLLDPVRSFAVEQLHAADEVDATYRRLLIYMVSLAERVPPEALNQDHAALLERDLENLRTSLFWAVTRAEADFALRLATAACSLWYFRGYFTEGCDWLERALALPGDLNTLARASAAGWLGQLLQFRGEYASAEMWIKYALDRQQVLGDPLGSALSVGMLGQLLLMRGDLGRARSLCAEASERLSKLGHPANIATRLQSAIIAIELSELAFAREVVGQCQAQDLDSQPPLAAWLRLVEARLAEAAGDQALAFKLLSEALEMSRAVSQQQAIVTSLVELGHVQLERNSNAQAMESFAEAIELAHQSGERIQLARALEGLARGYAAHQPAAAVRLAGAADRLRIAMGAIAWPSDKRRLEAWLPATRRKLKPQPYRAAWQAGHAIDTDQAVALARRLRTDAGPRLRAEGLTARERQVVELLARAHTTRQIAAELAISPATARTHVDHVLAKLGLHTRAQVVLWARQHPT